jgi:hypothetical protein
MKVCSKCSESKEPNQFYKKTKSKDGLQHQCKACFKESNEIFRLLNPLYQNQWYTNNHTKWATYISGYAKADKVPTIYAIVAPDGFVYVGKTKAYPNIRKMRHTNSYRLYQKGDRKRHIPLLHSSFDKHGIDNHQFKILAQFDGASDKELSHFETTFIKAFKMTNKSLNMRNN